MSKLTFAALTVGGGSEAPLKGGGFKGFLKGLRKEVRVALKGFEGGLDIEFHRKISQTSQVCFKVHGFVPLPPCQCPQLGWPMRRVQQLDMEEWKTVKVFGEKMVLRKFSDVFLNGPLMTECGLLVGLHVDFQLCSLWDCKDTVRCWRIPELPPQNHSVAKI